MVSLVHPGIGLQPHDEVRIGKDHLPIGFEIGQPRSHVAANLVARTTRPVEDQRLVPELADVAQQRLVALVQDMQMGEPELVEFGDEIAVEVRPFGAFVDSPQGRTRGQADRGAVRADLLCDRPGDLNGKAGAVLDGAPYSSVRVLALGAKNCWTR